MKQSGFTLHTGDSLHGLWIRFTVNLGLIISVPSKGLEPSFQQARNLPLTGPLVVFIVRSDILPEIGSRLSGLTAVI